MNQMVDAFTKAMYVGSKTMSHECKSRWLTSLYSLQRGRAALQAAVNTRDTNQVRKLLSEYRQPEADIARLQHESDAITTHMAAEKALNISIPTGISQVAGLVGSCLSTALAAAGGGCAAGVFAEHRLGASVWSAEG